MTRRTCRVVHVSLSSFVVIIEFGSNVNFSLWGCSLVFRTRLRRAIDRQPDPLTHLRNWKDVHYGWIHVDWNHTGICRRSDEKAVLLLPRFSRFGQPASAGPVHTNFGSVFLVRYTVYAGLGYPRSKFSCPSWDCLAFKLFVRINSWITFYHSLYIFG